LFVVLLQVIYGAFTAGLKAGFAFNTFPKMNGSWLPPGFMSLSPAITNLFENPYTIQFLHRTLGWLVAFLIIILWLPGIRRKMSDISIQALKFLTGWVIIQFLLGVFTLIYVIPIWLAVLHQAGAMILFLLSVYFIHTLSVKQL
jgi:cytochrome c oxidase assembly protein subunit 15